MAVRPPSLSNSVLATFVQKYFPFASVNEESFKQLDGYDDLNYKFAGKLVDQMASAQPRVTSDGHFVLKFLNSRDSSDVEAVEGLNNMMKYLYGHGICCPYPIPIRSPSQTVYNCSDDIVIIKHSDLLHYVSTVNGEANSDDIADKQYCVRVFEYIEGDVLGYEELSSDLLYGLGCYVGRMHKVLLDFNDTGIQNRQFFDWDLKYLMSRRDVLKQVVEDDEQMKILTSILDDFEEHVLPIMSELESGCLHTDINALNVITEQTSDGSVAIKGLIDFSDCVHGPYVFDLGTAAFYLMSRRDNNCVAYLKRFIDGYLSVFSLSKKSLDILYYVVLGRAAQSLINSAYWFKFDPANEYRFIDIKPGWKLLRTLLSTGRDDCHKQWGII